MNCTAENLVAQATAAGFQNLSEKQLLGVDAYLQCQIAAGGASAWTPLTPGTLVEWLKADAIAQSSGSSVATWPASFGINAVASGAAEPTLETNAQNGLPIVRYNGSSNYSTVTGLGSVSYPYTVAFAFRYQGSPTGGFQYLLYLGIPSPPDASAAVSMGSDAGKISIAAGQLVDVINADNNFHILFVVFNGASSKYGVDGGALVTCNPGTLIPLTALSLAALLQGANFGQIDIGELVLWTGDGTAFYTQAYSYLNTRWQ